MLNLKRLGFYCCFLLIYLIFQIILTTILRPSNQDTHTNALKILEIYKELAMKLKQPTEVDNSGLYKIFKMKSSKAVLRNDITIISQCSPNHFLSIENLFKAWKGPISIAIYSEVKYIETTLRDIAKFLHCCSKRDFQMQLVVPNQDEYSLNYSFALEFLTAVENSKHCNSPYESTQYDRKNYEWSSTYPINLLRNVAKKESSTDYILVIDIDMVPNSQLRYDFLNFTKLSPPISSEKVIYVVPAFETILNVSTPMDKANLLQLYFSLKARPFYISPCSDCQKLTDYKDWLASENVGARIIKRVKWKHPWEPFFIAKRDIPNFDERFKQYGMNRVSQICELHVAGFQFLILDNVFLVHKGFKFADDFHRTKNREMEANRRIYKRFKTEMKYKYPNSDRNC